MTVACSCISAAALQSCIEVDEWSRILLKEQRKRAERRKARDKHEACKERERERERERAMHREETHCHSRDSDRVTWLPD